jgi:intracellular septation protein
MKKIKEMFSWKLWINLLCEFGPIASFLTVFQIENMRHPEVAFSHATIAMVVVTCISFFVLLRFEKHVPYFALFNTISVILFGGVSAFVNIPDVFILRDTILDLILGIVLLVSLRYKSTGLQFFFGNVFAITEKGWKIFTLRWGIFYVILACANELIRQNASPDMWVKAKVWLIIGTVIFGMYQLTLTRRHRLPHANTYGMNA